MNRKHVSQLAFLALIIPLAALQSCAGKTPCHDKAAKLALREKQFGIVDSFKSEALAANALGDPSSRPIYVTLPPSYYDSPKTRYPVVYYLHGHNEGAGFLWKYRNGIVGGMKEGKIPQMIIVEPDCLTKFGGAFYSDSPVSGRHETYLTKELIAFIDANYRTIPRAEARGLAGFSMGAFGSLARGIGHPDIYSVVFSFGPGILRPEEGLAEAMEAWSDDPAFLNAYASTFSPTPGAKTPGNVPTLDGSSQDAAIVKDWYAGFGDWDKKLEAYRANPAKLKALRIVYGKNDEYQFIRNGCEYLNGLLNEKAIPHDFIVTNNSHRMTLDLTMDNLLPFMGANLLPME